MLDEHKLLERSFIMNTELPLILIQKNTIADS